MDLRSLVGNWIKGLPEIMQYIVVIGIVLVILYVCLAITRLFGKNKGEKVYYDDPEAYDDQVPDIFASTFMKRKSKEKNEEEAPEKQD